MKKISFLIVIFVLILLASSNAQIKIIINGGVQIPTSNFSNLAKAGFGSNLGAEYTVSSSVTSSTALTLNVGYNIYSSDKIIQVTTPGVTSTSTFTFNTVSILGGAKFFFEKIFYFGGALGFGSLGAGDETVGGVRIIFNSQSAFLWSPTFGVRLNNWDINANYNSMSKNGGTISWFGVNVGYVFGN